MSKRSEKPDAAAHVAVFASGRGSTFRALVQAAREGTLRATIVLLVVSRPEAPAAEAARDLGVECVVLDERTRGATAVDVNLVALLLARQVDLVILSGYLRKIGPRTLHTFAGRIVNTHPAPLPRFGGKGMFGDNVHRAVLDSGVPASAATVHLIDAEYDTGPVIAAQAVPVMPHDDVESLRTRVQEAERTLLVSAVNEMLSQLPNTLRRHC